MTDVKDCKVTEKFDIVIQKIKDDLKTRPQWEQDYLNRGREIE